MEYLITGNTYNIKEDLKAWGCSWSPEKKAWKTPWLEKDEIAYKMMKSLVGAHGGYMTPVELSPECRKIQEILNGL